MMIKIDDLDEIKTHAEDPEYVHNDIVFDVAAGIFELKNIELATADGSKLNDSKVVWFSSSDELWDV